MSEPRSEQPSSTEPGNLLLRLSAVHAFHPRALPDVPPAEVVSLLGRDVDIIPIGDDRTAWSLRDEVRAEWLRRHPDPASALAAARSVPNRPLTPEQGLLERWLERGSPPSPHERGLDLAALDHVSRWLAGVEWAASDVAGLRGRCIVAQRRRKLEAIGEKLFGRDEERRRLVAAAEGTSNERLIVLDAAGGMGKSALLARVELDLPCWADDGQIVVVHLDFDDPDVDYHSGAGLVAPMTRQLAQRMPESFNPLLHELESLEQRAADAPLESAEVTGHQRSELDSLDQYLLEQVQRALRTVSDERRFQRLLVVVDTVERPLREAPVLTARVLEALWAMIEPLPAAMVLSGRAIEVPPRLAPLAVPLPLGELSLDFAMTLLADQGVADPTMAEKLAKRLPRRPLTLRLAARAAQGAGSLDPDDPRLKAAIDKALVDGYLHLRVLNHVAPRLRALVYPGFAFRRLTPELVAEALADRTRPPVSGVEDARALLGELRRVSELVMGSERKDELVLRPEVRTELLQLMTFERPDEIRAVHARAAAWFARQPDPPSAAEAVYHLLAIGDLEGAEKRWQESMIPALAGADEELGEPARTWLAQRLGGARGLTGDPKGTLSQEAWEEQTAHELRSLIASRRLPEAEQLLRMREPRSEASPLFVLGARLYRQLGKAAEAEREVARAWSTDHTREEADELARINVWAALQRDDIDAAVTRADAARVKARALLTPVDRLRALVDLATMLGPQRESKARRALWLLEDEIGELFDQVPDDALRSDRGVLIGAAAVLHDASRLRRAIRLGAFERMRDPTLNGLRFLLATLGTSRAGQWVAEIADVARPSPQDQYPARAVVAVLGRSPQRLAKAADSILEERDEPAAIETIRSLIARDAVQASDSASSEARLAAMRDLEAILVARSEQRQGWLSSNEGAQLRIQLGLPSEVPPAILVAAADRMGAFGTLFDVLCRWAPEKIGELSLLRFRLTRPPPFQHFPHERMVALHAALMRTSLVQKAGVGPLFEGNLFGVPPPAANGSESPIVDLLDFLVFLNETERLGGFVPLELFLTNALRFSLGLEADAQLNQLFTEMQARHGVEEPVVTEPLEKIVRTDPRQIVPAAFFLASAAALRAVARLVVPRIFGGRARSESTGRPEIQMGTAWLITGDLLITVLHVLGAAPSEKLDTDDLAQRASSSTAHFDPWSPISVVVPTRGLVAWSDELDYAVLRVEPTDRAPLPIAAAPPAAGDLIVAPFADGMRGNVSVGLGELASWTPLQLHHTAGTGPGASGAPVCDAGWRAIGMHLGAAPGRDGGPLRGFAKPMKRILEDLQRRYPDVAARLEAG